MNIDVLKMLHAVICVLALAISVNIFVDLTNYSEIKSTEKVVQTMLAMKTGSDSNSLVTRRPLPKAYLYFTNFGFSLSQLPLFHKSI